MPQSTTYRAWTDDTRTAFLLALRLSGSSRAAAREIGRDTSVCYATRKRDPGFAAAWDAIVVAHRARRATARADARARERALAKAAAIAAATPGVPPSDERDASGHRRRWSGVNAVKRRAFLRGLAERGSVVGACQVAGVSDTIMYRLRAEDADFATAWDRALRTSAPALEQVAWERAVEGWDEPVFVGGKQVGVRRRYSERLLAQLLVKRETAVAEAHDGVTLVARAKDAARAAGGTFGTHADRDEVNAALLAKLDRAEARLGLEPPGPPCPVCGELTRGALARRLAAEADADAEEDGDGGAEA